jgi:phage-related protein (TIGR01555 family)
MRNKVKDIRKKAPNINTDGWNNVYTKQGVSGSDKQLGTSFSKPTQLTETLVEDIYRGDGISKRIIDLPTGEMLRRGYEVMGDTDGDIIKYLDKIHANKHLLQGLRWGRLYGGSIVVIGIDDGSNKLDEPVNETRIKSIEFLRVYDRYRVNHSTSDLYSDPAHAKFDTPEFYNVSPVSGTPFRIHESRVLVFDGVPVSDRIRQENQGWGDSYYQAIYNELANLAGVYFGARNVVDDFIQIILKIENLQDLIASGREDEIKTRLNIIDLGRHVMNTILLDAREEYEKSASSVAGLHELLGKFELMVSAVTGIPMTLLMGQSPAGMNATGESDITLWYDSVAEDQQSELKPQIERLVYLSMLAKQGPTKGKILPEWAVEFNPLWQPTESQIVETRSKQATIDKIYIEQSVLTAEEVAISRFGGDEYSHDTNLISKDRQIEDVPFEKPDDEDTDEE